MFPVFTIIIILFASYSIFKSIKRYRNKPNFTNKAVWITGASSGIGQYLAYQFNQKNANLIISSRNIKQLQRVKSSCKHPQKVKVVQLDMTNYEQIQKVTKQIIQQLQAKGDKLDIVVQNAGVSMRCLFKQYNFKNHLALQDVNVNGPYRHIQCFVEHMIKNKNGHIVGITSIAGKISTSHRSSYSGAKNAFIGILDSLRSQLSNSNSNITVTNIMPGYVRTNLSKNALVSKELQKFGKTDDNIQNGLDPAYFASISVKAIYNKQNQLQISANILMPLVMVLRNICPDLVFFIMRKNAKNQLQALQSAHS